MERNNDFSIAKNIVREHYKSIMWMLKDNGGYCLTTKAFNKIKKLCAIRGVEVTFDDISDVMDTFKDVVKNKLVVISKKNTNVVEVAIFDSWEEAQPHMVDPDMQYITLNNVYKSYEDKKRHLEL